MESLWTGFLGRKERDLFSFYPIPVGWLVPSQQWSEQAGLRADIHKQDLRGFPALTFAAGSGSVAVIKTLVNAGADINTAGRTNITALEWARLLGQQESMTWLQQAGGLE